MAADGNFREGIAGACNRAARLAHRRLKRGVNSLAMISSLAVLVGLFGTVWQLLFHTFVAYVGPKSGGIAEVARRVSDSLVPAALGVAVALQAYWSHRYLRSQLETLDSEMQNASLDLLNRLTVHLGPSTNLHKLGGN